MKHYITTIPSAVHMLAYLNTVHTKAYLGRLRVGSFAVVRQLHRVVHRVVRPVFRRPRVDTLRVEPLAELLPARVPVLQLAPLFLVLAPLACHPRGFLEFVGRCVFATRRPTFGEPFVVVVQRFAAFGRAVLQGQDTGNLGGKGRKGRSSGLEAGAYVVVFMCEGAVSLMCVCLV